MAMIVMAPLTSELVAGLPACTFRELSGIPCPGCGSSRAAELLSRFQFLEALRRFPLATLGWTGLIGGGLLAGVAGICGGSIPYLSSRWLPWIRWGLVAAIIANWLLLIRTGV